MVERYRSQVNEARPARAYGQNFATPASEGAGVGAAMAEGGQEIRRFATVVKDRQDRWDAARVMEAQNEYNRAMSDHMDNPETGVKATRKLGNARGVTDETDLYGDQLAEKISGTLDNPAQKRAFLSMAQRAKQPYWKQASQYEAGQVREYQNQQYKTTLENGVQSVTANPADGSAFDAALQQGAGAIRAQNFGGDPATTESAVREYGSKLEEHRIGVVAQSDPEAALKMAESSQYLQPTARAGVLPKLQRQVAQRQAQAEAEARKRAIGDVTSTVWDRFGTHEEDGTNAILNSDLPDDVKNSSVSRYQARVADQRRFDKREETDWFNDTKDAVADSKSLEAAQQVIENSNASGAQRRQLEAYAGQLFKPEGFKENLQDWKSAYQEVSSGTLRSSDELIQRWGGKLSDATLKGFVKSYYSPSGDWTGGGKGGAGTGSSRGMTYTGDETAAAIKNALDNVLRYPKDTQEGLRQRSTFVTAFGDEMAEQERAKGRKLTPVEKQDLLMKLSKNQVLSGASAGYEIPVPGYEAQMAERAGFTWNDRLRGFYRENDDGTTEKFDVNKAYTLPGERPSERGNGRPGPAPTAPTTPTGAAAPTGRTGPTDEREGNWTTSPDPGAPRALWRDDRPLNGADGEDEGQAGGLTPPLRAPRRFPDGRIMERDARDVKQTRASDGGEDSFQEAVKAVLGFEGGYANDPDDRGGETNFGVTAGTLAAARKAGVVDRSDVKGLTRDEAAKIYKSQFWDKYGLGELPQPVGLVMFDLNVNHGPGGMAKIAQRAVNDLGKRLGIDGRWGAQTRAAVKALAEADPKGFAAALLRERKAYYDGIISRNPSQAKFKKGWYDNRLVKLAALAGVESPV
jgi:lysozyme family protein